MVVGFKPTLPSTELDVNSSVTLPELVLVVALALEPVLEEELVMGGVCSCGMDDRAMTVAFVLVP